MLEEKISSKKIYENPWIRLDEHDVIQPRGGKGIYSVVHFQNLAIAVLPLDNDYNTWIVGQWRYPVNEYSWEIPEGGGNMNEQQLPTIVSDYVDYFKLKTGVPLNLVRKSTSPLMKLISIR